MKYFHNTLNTLCIWIVTAGKLFDSIIVRDEIPITNMPPVQSTTLDAFQLEEIVIYWEESQAKLIKAVHTESHSVIDIYSVPSFQQL